ncbi:MAG: methyltransferase domain-containing protein [Chloroflexi bacterium]|nr:methyltransferase domain-containing protein [Chloroflexota bacterium]MBV9893410.1 methyltransferase domain-containing protein [Chloroflexota bacterium]
MPAVEPTELTARRLREALVRAMLRDGSLRRGRVERAFLRVPRHVFVPEVDLDIAYRDNRIPTKLQAGEIVSSSSQPAIMAIMLEQLDVRQGHRVLEVGAGTGYNAALLAELVGPRGEVTSIDLDADTVERARTALAQAGYGRVRVEQADGEAGFGESTGYDRIIATVGLGDLPFALWSQLEPTGRLVLPLSMRGLMKSVGFRKERNGRLVSTSISPAGFMPFRGAAPLLLQELRLGPELGLYGWSSQPGLDTDLLYGTLQRPDFADIAADLQLSRRELRSGLDLWLRAHQPNFVQVHAEGALAESTSLPAFTRSPWAHPAMRDRVSIGIWESGALALLAAASDHADPIHVLVRVWGETEAGDRLVDCIRAWRAAGSPRDEDLQLRLIPRGGRVHSGATIPMSAGTLELTWRRRD